MNVEKLKERLKALIKEVERKKEENFKEPRTIECRLNYQYILGKLEAFRRMLEILEED